MQYVQGRWQCIQGSSMRRDSWCLRKLIRQQGENYFIVWEKTILRSFDPANGIKDLELIYRLQLEQIILNLVGGIVFLLETLHPQWMSLHRRHESLIEPLYLIGMWLSEGSKNKRHKDTCLNEIELCFQMSLPTPNSIMNIIGRRCIQFRNQQTCKSFDNHNQIKGGLIGIWFQLMFHHRHASATQI